MKKIQGTVNRNERSHIAVHVSDKSYFQAAAAKQGLYDWQFFRSLMELHRQYGHLIRSDRNIAS